MIGFKTPKSYGWKIKQRHFLALLWDPGLARYPRFKERTMRRLTPFGFSFRSAKALAQLIRNQKSDKLMSSMIRGFEAEGGRLYHQTHSQQKGTGKVENTFGPETLAGTGGGPETKDLSKRSQDASRWRRNYKRHAVNWNDGSSTALVNRS